MPLDKPQEQATETAERSEINDRHPASDQALAVVAHPPVPSPEKKPRRRFSKITIALSVVLIIAAVGGAIGWWVLSRSRLPAGISYGNGRIEADEIDIDTKFAGRLAQLYVDIGDTVNAGEVVARMDTSDIEQSLKKAQELVKQADRAIEEANATLAQQQTQQTLAEQEMERAAALLKNGWTTQEIYDQRRQALDGAKAGVNAAQARIAQAEHARQAAEHDVQLYTVNIKDNELVAPRFGRIQYRVANIGEVLPAGGRVFTMLDMGYVYMDIYLPTLEAGKVLVGTDARIVLDAYPNHPIPAKVSFVASRAQFTPKTVETKNERDKLMFRIRVRIDRERSLQHADYVRSGLPGVAYIKTDPKVNWPSNLEAAP